MPLTKPTKGSILVFSLIVLSVILSAALSITAVTVSNRKSAGSTSQSVQSFQVADSGVEKALKEIYKGSYADLSTMASAFGTSCLSGSFSFPVSGGTSTVTFFDTNNAILTCASPTWRDDVAKIKVEGTSAGTTRVIETAVAAASLSCDNYEVSTGTYDENTCALPAYHGSGAQCVSLAVYASGLGEWVPRDCNGSIPAPHSGNPIHIRCCK